MASGLEIRAQIDTETVKGLLIINGGGAVALLAFIPSVIGKPEYSPLAVATLISLFLFQIGLLAAVIHNRFRRKCSLEYEQANMSSPAGFPTRKILWWEVSEPCVCIKSIISMWVSIAMFFIASMALLIGGICVIGVTPPKEGAVERPIQVQVYPVMPAPVEIVSTPTNHEAPPAQQSGAVQSTTAAKQQGSASRAEK